MFTFFIIKILGPLEQFEINILTKGTWSLFTNVFVFIMMTILFCILFLFFSQKNDRLNYISTFLNLSLRLVTKIVFENSTLSRNQYVPILFYLFIFILVSNFVGLFPFAWTITNSFVITFFFAFSHFFAINLWAFFEKKMNFFKLFLPSGVPLILAPLIVPIEFISYFSRIFSLSIRLFANISSGHALLKILIGFSWNLIATTLNHISFFNGILCILAAIFPWVLIVLIFFLEILIGFLQSYVFIILLTIYINDVISDEH